MLIRFDHDPLLKVIAWLHAGAASQESWSKGLDLLSDLTGGSQLLVGTTPHRDGPFSLVGHRMDAGIVDHINGPLASEEANPVFSAVPLAAVQKPVIVSSRLPERSLLHSRLYNEALKPSGVRYTMALLLACDSREALTLALGRGSKSGDYGEGEAQLLALLAPHLCSALQLQRDLELARARAGALDTPGRGLLLVGKGGEICHANAEAERILRDNDGLGAGPAGVNGGRGEEAQRLRRLIGEAVAAAGGTGTSAGGFVSLSRPSMRQPYIVRVAPAAAPLQERHGLKPQPMAALFIRGVDRQLAPSIEALQAVYRLTRMEAEVALEVYEGLTMQELSEALGISPNTAKTHLKNIFEKVGVQRQSALVSRIAAAIGEMGAPA